MAEDIRLDLSFVGHRKRKKLQLRLGHEGVVCLIDLWLMIAEHRPHGMLAGYDSEDIEIDAGWTGEPGLFVETLCDLRFLDRDASGVYSAHNWEKRQAWVATEAIRSDKARLNRMARSHPDIYSELKEKGVEAISREEFDSLTAPQRLVNDPLTKTENEGTPAPAPAPSPAPSPSPAPYALNTLSDRSDDKQGSEAVYLTKKKRPLKGKRLETFERFWSDFDYKHGKAEAADAWMDISSLTKSLVDRICEAARSEAQRRPGVIASGRTPKMAQGWLTARRWEDEVSKQTMPTPIPRGKPNGNIFDTLVNEACGEIERGLHGND